MASKNDSKPLISGGRTLSRCLRGRAVANGGGKGKKAKVWFQSGNNKGPDRGNPKSRPGTP